VIQIMLLLQQQPLPLSVMLVISQDEVKRQEK